MTVVAGILSWVLIGLLSAYIIGNAATGVKAYLDRRKKRNGDDDKSNDVKGG